MTYLHTNIKWAGIHLLSIILCVNIASANSEMSKLELLEKSLINPAPAIRLTDDPPPEPIIAVAEFEPAEGVLVSYPLPLPMHLIVEMAEDCVVWTVVDDENEMQQALGDYVLAGVDTSNCSFLIAGAPTDWWTRDYGPWYIFTGNDELGIINNDYFWYAQGNVSTDVPVMLGDSLGIPVYSTGIRNEGGNYMTDGMGKVIVTDWLEMVNPLTPPEAFPGTYEDYLGIETFILTGTHLAGLHIDMWAKYLDPERIIVIDPEVPNQGLEDWVDYFQTLMSSYGRPYEIIRVPGVGYSNALILNNKVLVPQFNWSTDSLALVAYEEAMPGYEVYGFYWWSFSDGDALHCRTHEMADQGMLRIVHIPIHDLENDGSDYYLETDIHPYSNEPLIAPPVIMWKTEGGSYSPVTMTFAGDDIYYGEIPQQPDGTDIYYYLEAEDGSGRVENHPYIGEGNPHHFHVGSDDEPPIVEFNPLTSIQASEWPLPFKAYALDNRWISEVAAEYSINGLPQTDVDMELIEPFAVYYRGTPTGTVQAGDVIEVRVKAVDTSVNQNTTYSDYYTITIEGTTDRGSEQITTGLHPNPFNPITVLSFQLQDASLVNLTVYNVSGKKVAELVNGWRDAGVHEVTFDASKLASGIYVYRLEASGSGATPTMETGKMVLMK
ncbi:hypothetical protein CEE37_14120 [candidate division LCP-89 bacterium B3_LCP]|uniref:Secretion system C-terminal sorting domain-containing protein n=1 Tax=candidate division LCP-89 bacterium B3_LCP TaxID=2012998 RepID=A0A532UQN0_UNCL8|nr:MAG: hypothetical protein CEE37_14120 [candidate division LCP-89 bacterium B3_LCP]